MLGRADDIINVGGEKVSPIEVENIAGEYEHVKECACIGVPDPDAILGFVPVMFVVPRDNQYSEEEFTRFLAQRMERYKLPTRFYFAFGITSESDEKTGSKSLKTDLGE